MTNVLLVDDNSQNLYLLETMLKAIGYKVITAKNGAEALDLAREIPPDLIISDILMPVMDGYQLCRLWKSDAQLKHVPFIFYTATYTEPKDEQLALSLGAEGFLIKPQQPEVLMQVINNTLCEFGKGKNVTQEKPLGEKMEFLRDYNEVLFRKLEKKVLQLECEVTERKNAQQALKRLNSELEARVEERTKALKDAVKKMMQQEKLVVVGKLARSISHELRNPIGVITNSIYYLNLKIPATDEKIKKYLLIIQEQSMRVTKIINDLLDITRMKPIDCHDVDLHALLKETLSLVQTPKNIVVNTIFDFSLQEVFLDPITVQHAFMNIITNAFQAMVDGGELEIKTSIHGGMIEVAFKDTGVGIPEENLPFLFEPLFSTKVNGIGLGLPIAKEIIESINGRIDVESAVGIGSTFTVKLPVLQITNPASK